MIEDAKAVLRTWGALEPNFLLCNSKLTFQMTMTPEKTQYLTQGPDGIRRLKAGPNIASYRGLSIIHSRSFAIEDGAPPRDVLRRRTRVAEYYRIPWESDIEKKHFSFYDESKDAWQKFSWTQLFAMANIGEMDEDDIDENNREKGPLDEEQDFGNYEPRRRGPELDGIPRKYKTVFTKFPNGNQKTVGDFEIGRAVWDEIMHEITARGNPYTRLLGMRDEPFMLNPLVQRPRLEEWEAMLLDIAEDAFAEDIPQNAGEDREQNHEHENQLRGRAQYVLHTYFENTANEDGAYENEMEKLRQKLSVYFKLFMTGRRNEIPYAVSKFLGHFNWQGIYDHTRLLGPRQGGIPPPQNLEQAAVDARGGGGDGIPSRATVVTSLLHCIYNLIPVQDDFNDAIIKPVLPDRWELVVIRPNIEHNMLAIIMGRGGLDELGATFWGQSELSCYDDSMHGIWGMSYKYNEKAIVINNKNLIRLWDVAYDGYNGGKDCSYVNWQNDDSLHKFAEDTYEMNRPYEGSSMIVMAFKNVDDTEQWPSPILFHDAGKPSFLFVV